MHCLVVKIRFTFFPCWNNRTSFLFCSELMSRVSCDEVSCMISKAWEKMASLWFINQFKGASSLCEIILAKNRLILILWPSWEYNMTTIYTPTLTAIYSYWFIKVKTTVTYQCSHFSIKLLFLRIFLKTRSHSVKCMRI